MKTYRFKVVVEPDEDAQGNPAWFAHIPALESIGAATSGRTREEALRRISEVVRMIVQESTTDLISSAKKDLINATDTPMGGASRLRRMEEGTPSPSKP